MYNKWKSVLCTFTKTRLCTRTLDTEKIDNAKSDWHSRFYCVASQRDRKDRTQQSNYCSLPFFSRLEPTSSQMSCHHGFSASVPFPGGVGGREGAYGKQTEGLERERRCNNIIP